MNSTYKGKILISTPDISGDIFSRSVVLVIDHDQMGAFGLILNKKNKELSRKITSIMGFNTDIYEGGPVENNKTFILAKGKPITEFFIEISPEFYLTEDVQTITNAVLEGNISLEDIKVFSGYSGWSTMQLESEIQKKMWTVVEVYNLDYTLPNDESLWKKIMQNLGGEFLIWANAPDNVSLN